MFFALDLLAWDMLVGFSLLFAARSILGTGLRGAVRRAMTVGGALCVAGTLGPALGDLRFQFLGIAGYAGVLPVASLLLAILFSRATLDSVGKKTCTKRLPVGK